MNGGDRYVHSLRECIGALPARSRQAVELSYHEGRSRSQIAERLGITSAGVKALLRRVREALKSCVEKKTET